MLHTVRPIRPHGCATKRCEVSASPQALSQLYGRYLDLKAAGRLPETMTFEDYYWVLRSSRRGEKFWASTTAPCGWVRHRTFCRRSVLSTAKIHASVAQRMAKQPGVGMNLPRDAWVDPDWLSQQDGSDGSRPAEPAAHGRNSDGHARR